MVRSACPEWSSQITALLSMSQEQQQKRQSDVKWRAFALVKSRGVITVAAASAALGVPDVTARRALEELTPAYLRIVEGRPKKWRAK